MVLSKGTDLEQDAVFPRVVSHGGGMRKARCAGEQSYKYPPDDVMMFIHASPGIHALMIATRPRY